VCVEGPSGILEALDGMVGQWNRSIGEITTVDGSRIFLDGADDGALRVQGKNLRGAWCDEVGLWVQWQRSWDESVAFAVRMSPGKIVATGTPKMGHGLVRRLVESETIPKSHMRMEDNIENLAPGIVAELKERYEGTTLGKQELEGLWIPNLEGDVLRAEWWKLYEPQGIEETDQQFSRRLPAFTQLISSWDLPQKDKESSDFVAGQLWGVHKSDRYLLASVHGHFNYSTSRRLVIEQWNWARSVWPQAKISVLVEKGGYGSDLAVDLKREITGVHDVNPGPLGSKGMRAFAASGDLESGNCWLPGYADPAGGVDEQRSPAGTVSFVVECAMFRVDSTHDSHDDQVDAWSQAMNWLRRKQTTKARVFAPPAVRL